MMIWIFGSGMGVCASAIFSSSAKRLCQGATLAIFCEDCNGELVLVTGGWCTFAGRLLPESFFRLRCNGRVLHTCCNRDHHWHLCFGNDRRVPVVFLSAFWKMKAVTLENSLLISGPLPVFNPPSPPMRCPRRLPSQVLRLMSSSSSSSSGGGLICRLDSNVDTSLNTLQLLHRTENWFQTGDDNRGISSAG